MPEESLPQPPKLLGSGPTELFLYNYTTLLPLFYSTTVTVPVRSSIQSKLKLRDFFSYEIPSLIKLSSGLNYGSKEGIDWNELIQLSLTKAST